MSERIKSEIVTGTIVELSSNHNTITTNLGGDHDGKHNDPDGDAGAK